MDVLKRTLTLYTRHLKETSNFHTNNSQTFMIELKKDNYSR